MSTLYKQCVYPGSTQRLTCVVPRWFVKACKVYFVCVRPKFMPPHQAQTRASRRFEEDTSTGCDAYTVVTDYFFYNTSKLRTFRVRQINKQLQSKLSTLLNQPNDVLTRKVKMLFPADMNPEAKIETDATMMRVAIEEFGENEYDEKDLKKAIARRSDQLLFARSSERAAVYIDRFPKGRLTTDGERELMSNYYRSKMWGGDFAKFANNVQQLRQATSARNSATFIDPLLKFKDIKGEREKAQATQIEILERITKQTWPGIADGVFPGFGRGVMATMPFMAGDVIVDYHGTVSKVPYDTYIKQPRPDGTLPKTTFILVIQNFRKLIDATNERCSDHANTRCLGRLSNHANTKNRKKKLICNMKPVYVELNHLPKDSYGKYQKVVLFVARRNILALEQLRWDYEDKTAQAQLTE